jgi:hypothetical protein
LASCESTEKIFFHYIQIPEIYGYYLASDSTRLRLTLSKGVS